jgi:hypothetical protein
MIVTLVVCFQNCSNPSDGKSAVLASGGPQNNGEPYVGKIGPGTYYARELDYRCDAGTSGPRLENVRTILKVEAGASSAQVTDNCSGAISDVALNQFSASSVSPDYVSGTGRIYQRFDSAPPPNAPVPNLLCHFASAYGFSGIDHITLQVPNGAGSNMLVLLTRFARPQQPSVESGPNAVTGMESAQYPAGVPATKLIAQDVELYVSAATPDGLNHPGYFNGVVDGSQVSGDGICVDLTR